MKKTETYLGRDVKQKIFFSRKGTFESLYAAQGWCTENGYSYGSLCGQQPVAIMYGPYELPQKWKNMDIEDKFKCDGVIVSNDFREGSATVYLFEQILLQ
jgi:hypothetical protein